ncbi:unnamed protein product [Moneuplotes crassus]|uniref:Uncharacterized protein n=1 Tax=Euplotes crassus TaxID=5936 RepID=A0AAD1UQ35_EUPCR|nr:unnamed protein product [Moneuplotes crassus]
MESMTKATEEKDIQKISLEKSVLSKTKKQDIARGQSIFYKFSPECKIEPLDSDSGEAPKNSALMIGSNDLGYIEFAQSFKNIKFFDTDYVSFDYVDSKARHYKNFLESSFPDKTNGFGFFSDYKIDLKRSNYLNSLLRVSSKVLQKTLFAFYCISLPSLKRLVAAYKHVGEFTLWSCSLSIPSVPDFSKALSNCQIQKLDLNCSGCFDCSDWENNFNEFKNLVQGLASSPDLRLSLKEVNIVYCEVNQAEVEQTFKENQLGGVKIIDEY